VNVEIIEGERIIHVLHQGDISDQDPQVYRELLSKYFIGKDIIHVFVDVSDVRFDSSTLQLFMHGVAISNNPVMQALKYAIVISEEIEKDAQFIETVCRNREINIRIFKSKDEAILWLKE